MNNRNELYHYGVAGMKWGIRRYQNSDGTLTATGKERVRKKTEKVNKTFDRKTKRANKILSKSDRYSEKKVRKAKAVITRETKLKDLRTKEIKKHLNTLEEQAFKSTFWGQFVAGIPGQVAASGADYLRNRGFYDEGSAKRAEIRTEYKKNRG